MPSEGNLYVHCRGKPVALNAEAINQRYGLTPLSNAHSDFEAEVTDVDFELIKDDLCYNDTPWETGNHRGSVTRLSLKPEAKMWCTFVKRRLMPTSHNSTVDRRRLVLIQSIINKRTINVGEIILQEIYDCGKKDKSSLCFPSLISVLCIAAGVPVEATDEYTPNRPGWSKDFCRRVMQITQAEPVQATPYQFTADFTAGG